MLGENFITSGTNIYSEMETTAMHLKTELFMFVLDNRIYAGCFLWHHIYTIVLLLLDD